MQKVVVNITEKAWLQQDMSSSLKFGTHSCVTLGKSLNFSGPPFYKMAIVNHYSIYLRELLGELNELMYVTG
jgi:hypothetical protein